MPFNLTDNGKALNGMFSSNPHQTKIHNVLPLLFQLFRLKLIAHEKHSPYFLVSIRLKSGNIQQNPLLKKQRVSHCME